MHLNLQDKKYLWFFGDSVHQLRKFRSKNSSTFLIDVWKNWIKNFVIYFYQLVLKCTFGKRAKVLSWKIWMIKTVLLAISNLTIVKCFFEHLPNNRQWIFWQDIFIEHRVFIQFARHFHSFFFDVFKSLCEVFNIISHIFYFLEYELYQITNMLLAYCVAMLKCNKILISSSKVTVWCQLIFSVCFENTLYPFGSYQHSLNCFNGGTEIIVQWYRVGWSNIYKISCCLFVSAQERKRKFKRGDTKRRSQTSSTSLASLY